MSSIYPGGLDSFPTNRTDATPMVTNQPGDHNDYADAINKIEATLGVDPQGIYSTVGDRLNGIATTSPYTKVSVPISSAEIMTLFSIPVELIPSPGPGLGIFVQSAIATYQFGTVVYDCAATGILQLGPEGYEYAFFAPNTPLFSQNHDIVTDISGDINEFGSNTASTKFDDKRWVLRLELGDPALPAGDGTASIHLVYRTITL